MLSGAKSENQRGGLFDCDHATRLLPAYYAQGIAALQFGRRQPDCLQEVSLFPVKSGDQIRHHFCIGIGGKGDPFPNQLFPQRQVVFDDAVMYYGNFSVPGELRVGILIVGSAVGGPTGVTDPHRAGQFLVCLDFITEYLEPAFAFCHLQPIRALDANPGGVIAAVFQFG